MTASSSHCSSRDVRRVQAAGLSHGGGRGSCCAPRRSPKYPASRRKSAAARAQRHPKTRLVLLDEVQQVALVALDHCVVGHHLAGKAGGAAACARQPDERVAAEAFAAHHRFEQEAVRAPPTSLRYSDSGSARSANASVSRGCGCSPGRQGFEFSSVITAGCPCERAGCGLGNSLADRDSRHRTRRCAPAMRQPSGRRACTGSVHRQRMRPGGRRPFRDPAAMRRRQARLPGRPTCWSEGRDGHGAEFSSGGPGPTWRWPRPDSTPRSTRRRRLTLPRAIPGPHPLALARARVHLETHEPPQLAGPAAILCASALARHSDGPSRWPACATTHPQARRQQRCCSTGRHPLPHRGEGGHRRAVPGRQGLDPRGGAGRARAQAPGGDHAARDRRQRPGQAVHQGHAPTRRATKFSKAIPGTFKMGRDLASRKKLVQW